MVRKVPVYSLNIAANPHEPGTYRDLLVRAARIIVKARGNDYARITPLIQNERYKHIFQGQILIWTEIDIDGPWIDLDKGEQIDVELRRAISIPPNARPNFRAFDFIFDEKTHLLYFEARNDFDQTVGATVVYRIFSGLLNQTVLGPDFPNVEVTLVPEKDAVKKIISLPRLNSLFIRVVRPNPDGASPERVRRINAKLDALHAQKLETKIQKAPEADRITLNDEYKELAEVAAVNGVVKGDGWYADGTKAELSTSDQPKSLFQKGLSGYSRL